MKKRLFKVSVTNIVIEAQDTDSAIQGFANYMNDLGNSCFDVKEIKDKSEIKEIRENEMIDWTECI